MVRQGVIILSGGMDSATLMYKLIEDGYELHALTFDYGQRHEVEIECARRLVEFHLIPWKLVDLKVLGDVAPSSQTRSDIDVPHGRYDEENMKLTVVPNRNMVMLSLAVAYAIGEKIPEVFYGAHAGDHTIYPDCRVEFIEKLNAAVNIADWFRVDIVAPFSGMTKGEIASLGITLGVPFEYTHSCYEGTFPPCGKCGACTERKEAFEYAGIKDPLL